MEHLEPSPEASEHAGTHGSSSWVSRNPSKEIIPTHPSTARSSGARKATNDKKKALRKKALEELHAYLVAHAEAEADFMKETVAKFNHTTAYMTRLINSHSKFKTPRATSWQNAMIHYKTMQVNAGRSNGDKLKLKEIQQLVAENEELQASNKEQWAELIAQLVAYCALSKQGAQANNAAAAADFRVTIKSISVEFENLAEHVGSYSFAFSTRSHIHDEFHASYITDSINTSDFFTEVLNMSPSDVAQKFELWAIAHEKGSTTTDTLASLRMTVTTLIANGLCIVTNTPGLTMSYKKYDMDIIIKLGVKLVGWPEGVLFASLSAIGTVGDLRILREALKCGECHWVALSHREKEAHAAKVNAAIRSGDSGIKKRKQRSDKGKKRKKKAAATDEPTVASPPAKKRKTATSSATPSVLGSLPPMLYKSAEFVDDSEDLDDD